MQLPKSELEGITAFPIISLVVTYVLLVPLVIFAVHGGFSFEPGAWNSDLGAIGGKFAAPLGSADAARESLQSWLAMGLCTVPMLFHWRSVCALVLRMRLMALLPLYAIVSAIWSQDPLRSLRSGILLLATSLFAIYLVTEFGEQQQMELIILTGACVGIWSLLLVAFWPQFGIDHQLHEGAWQGLFTQKNVCAESTLFMLTPALAIQCSGRYGQLLQALYIGMCLSIIVMSQSRTGWIMTILYFVFTVILRMLGRFQRRDLLPLFALVLAAFGAVIVSAVQYPTLLFTLISRSDSFSGRAQIWSAIGASILRCPVGGYGFDAFWSFLQGEASRVFAAAGWVVTSAHNGFLNVALELGVVGLALVVATFVQAFRNASSAFRPGRSNYVDWCIGLIFLTLIYNLDERTLMATQYLPWVLYVLACAGLSKASRVARLDMNLDFTVAESV